MDQGNLAQYRQALTGAGQTAAPTPMGGAPAPAALTDVFAHLGALSQSGSNGEAARHALLSTGGAANAIDSQQKADANLQLQKEQDNLTAAAQAKKDALDPSKYKKEISQDGGYNFFDPQGNPIDVKQFSAATGKHITDVLKDSQNPADTQFVQDYKQIQKIGSIMQNGDKPALDKLYKQDPSLKQQIGDKTYKQIVTDFRNFYPKFFNSQPTSTVGTSYGGSTPSSISNGGGSPNILGRIKSLLG